MTIFLLSVLAALGISALCSLLESSLLSFTPGQVADLSRQYPRRGAIWQDFKNRIDRPIAAILILNTAAHTIGATIAGAKFGELYGGENIIWFSLLFTFLMLQFTEILPKTLGVYYNRRLAPMIAYPLEALIRLLRPILFLIRLINRPFERRRDKNQPEVTLTEIATLAGLARLSNLISPHQEKIIQGASRLSRLSAREVMIPVEHVTFLSASQNLMEAIHAAHQDPHTRFPICEGEDRDRVLGYVNFKEIIYYSRTNPDEQSLRDIILSVHFVGPDESASQLLRVFVDQHAHMAIVRDEQGKTLGLVTMEDVVEELVGELEDEFDRLPRMLHQLGGNVWIVGGGVPVRELASKLGLTLPETRSTISAWLIEQFGRIPRTNEVHQHNSVKFTIRRTRRGKIFEVLVGSRTKTASQSQAEVT